jgi:uncharacterized phage protein (TIGR02218 family)
MSGNELSSLAFCWTVERCDGAGLALTNHDRALQIDGTRYEPSPGMTPASIRSELGLEPRSSEVAGSLSSIAISEADMLAGRWDGASLTLVASDWAGSGTDQQELIGGELGQVSSGGGSFEAELLGVAAKLSRPICPMTSPLCRAELGDPDCRVDMAGRRVRAKVTAMAAHLVTLDAPIGDQFEFGQLRFLAGPANGERRTILSVQGQQLTLRSAPSVDVALGTPVAIVEGCDKRLSTCSERFANTANFRGEPHLPGNDLLTRYPGA